MTRNDWTRAVRHRLIDRGETVSDMARALGRSRQWVYQVFQGELDGVSRINEYLGLGGEYEELTD